VRVRGSGSQCRYAYTFEIDLDKLVEPVLCAPNDPDDARLLSEVQGTKIDEVFIGSCMTNIGHFRAAGKLLKKHTGQLPTRLWIAPPTKMDAAQLTAEGYYAIFGSALPQFGPFAPPLAFTLCGALSACVRTARPRRNCDAHTRPTSRRVAGSCATRAGGRAHRDAGLLPLHGQPGACG
jgi:aconitase B